MAINLHSKYDKKIQSAFARESLISGRLSSDYSFSGVKTVKISTPLTVPMNDYVRTGSNRYGDPVEMQDTVQELTLTQDKSFSLVIDKGNSSDQSGTKEAGKMLALQIAERAVPLMDTYCFKRLAQKAGKIKETPAAYTKATIIEGISDGTVFLDNAEVPESDRTLFVPADIYKMIRLSPEFVSSEKLAVSALAKGQVGRYDGMDVIKVPAGRWPANLNFMIVHKCAATSPVKLNDTKLHRDPPGISGNLLEGRQYYDLFVFGAKSSGVYVDIFTGTNGAKKTVLPVISAAGAFSGSGTGAVYYFTTDGSDPRYSASAKVGSVADVTAAGTVVKAYAEVNGSYSSDVASKTL